MTYDPRTDRRLLTTLAYCDDSKLAARQSMYSRWQRPRVDLPGQVVAALSGTTGVVADVGCGNRVYLERLRRERPDLRLLGLDLASGMQPDAVADAQQLPVADAAVDGVLALHMLYYVPDIDRALREFRRVLRPAGVLVASTNGLDHNAEMRDLWQAATAAVTGTEVGDEADPLPRFDIEKGAQLLRRVFPGVELREFRAFVDVPTADAVTAYIDSMRDIRASLLPPGVAWRSVLSVVGERAEATVRRNGVFRTSTHTGLFVCHF